MSPCRVFLVDDHALFRAGVKAELANLGDERIEVVGEAGSVNPFWKSTTSTAGRWPKPTRPPMPLAS